LLIFILLQQNAEWYIMVLIYSGCPGNWLLNSCSNNSASDSPATYDALQMCVDLI